MHIHTMKKEGMKKDCINNLSTSLIFNWELDLFLTHLNMFSKSYTLAHYKKCWPKSLSLKVLKILNDHERLFISSFIKITKVETIFLLKFIHILSGLLRILTCSWHQNSNSPFLQFSNLKCCIKAKESYKTPF